MRRFVIITLLVIGLFSIFAVCFAISNFCASLCFILTAIALAVLLTREPWASPDPTEDAESIASFNRTRA